MRKKQNKSGNKQETDKLDPEKKGGESKKKKQKEIKRSILCRLHKFDLYFFISNNGTGTTNDIDIICKKVYDTNMEPVPNINRGDSYNRGNTTEFGRIREYIKKKGKVRNGLRKNRRTGNSVCGW